jgi:hypothetical protein
MNTDWLAALSTSCAKTNSANRQHMFAFLDCCFVAVSRSIEWGLVPAVVPFLFRESLGLLFLILVPVFFARLVPDCRPKGFLAHRGLTTSHSVAPTLALFPAVNHSRIDHGHLPFICFFFVMSKNGQIQCINLAVVEIVLFFFPIGFFSFPPNVFFPFHRRACRSQKQASAPPSSAQP